MAPNAAKAAHRSDGGDPRNLQPARTDNSVNSAKPVNQQYRLIASVPKNAREEYRIAIGDFNGVSKIEIRVFERDGFGILRPTSRRMIISRGPIPAVIAALCEAEARL
jgi:hypothetical protein